MTLRNLNACKAFCALQNVDYLQWLQILQEHQDNGGLVEVLIWHLHTSLRRMSSTSIRYYKNAWKSWILFFGVKAKGLSTRFPLSDGNAVFLPMNKKPNSVLKNSKYSHSWELLQVSLWRTKVKIWVAIEVVLLHSYLTHKNCQHWFPSFCNQTECMNVGLGVFIETNWRDRFTLSFLCRCKKELVTNLTLASILGSRNGVMITSTSRFVLNHYL